jgi:hypothetical protein
MVNSYLLALGYLRKSGYIEGGHTMFTLIHLMDGKE